MDKSLYDQKFELLTERRLTNLVKKGNKKALLKNLTNVVFLLCYQVYEEKFDDALLMLNDYLDYLIEHQSEFEYGALFELIIEEVIKEKEGDYYYIGTNINSIMGLDPDKVFDIVDLLSSINKEVETNVCDTLFNLCSEAIEQQKALPAVDIINYLNERDYPDILYLYFDAYYSLEGYVDIDKAIETLEAIVKKGDILYNTNLGLIYEEQLHDMEKAAKYFKLALKSKAPVTYYNWGRIHHQYQQFYDLDIAIEYLKKAANLGYSLAEVNLGNVYLIPGDHFDLEEALVHIRKSLDYSMSLNNLGTIYLNYDKYKNNDLAYTYFLQAAEKGDPFGTFNVANMHQQTIGYIDEDKAIEYYNKFLEIKESFFRKDYFTSCAYNNLGVLYRQHSKKPDLDKALEYFHKSTMELSLWNLADIYLNEKNDIHKSLEYCLKLIEKENDLGGDAFNNVIDSYVLSDDNLDFIIASLNKIDNAYAYKSLGDLYKDNEQSIYNINKSKEYYEKAIEKDSTYQGGYYGLGYLYYYGLGVDKDLNKAKELFQSCKANDGDCQQILNVIIEELDDKSNNNVIKKLYNKDYSHKHTLKIIEDVFYNLPIDEEVESDLITALLNYADLVEAEESINKKLDYSSVIGLLFKGLENMIRINFIDLYRKYLLENVDPADLKQNKYFVYLSDAGTYEYLEHGKFERFTLLDFKKVTGYSKYQGYLNAIEVNKSFNSNITSDTDAAHCSFDNELLYYLQLRFHIKGLKGFRANDETKNFLIYLNEYIELNNDKYRNASVHYSIMSRSDAENLINEFLFTKKIIVNFYNRCQSDNSINVIKEK